MSIYFQVSALKACMRPYFYGYSLQTFGNGAIAQYILSKSAKGTFLTVNIGYGIGLMMGAYVAAGVTGAHMNPAVTFAMALRGKTAWIKVFY